uniref:C-type lectin domain-containing protein n=1 Tax=Meloidogyne floridensis TaxID=298350 RepID=A0A915PB59_9BILA
MLEYLIFILLFAAFTNAAHVVYINDGFDVDSAAYYHKSPGSYLTYPKQYVYKKEKKDNYYEKTNEGYNKEGYGEDKGYEYKEGYEKGYGDNKGYEYKEGYGDKNEYKEGYGDNEEYDKVYGYNEGYNEEKGYGGYDEGYGGYGGKSYEDNKGYKKKKYRAHKGKYGGYGGYNGHNKYGSSSSESDEYIYLRNYKFPHYYGNYMNYMQPGMYYNRPIYYYTTTSTTTTTTTTTPTTTTEETTPTPEDTTPEDTTPTPEDTTPTPEDTTTQEDTTPTPEDTTPTPEDTTTQEETTPTPEDTTQPPEDTTTPSEDTTPTPEDTTPTPEDTTPTPDDTTPTPEDTTPASEDRTPTPEDTTATPEDTTPPPEDTTPPSEDTTPPPEDTTPPSEDTTPPPEDTTPTSEDTTLSPEDTTPPSEDTTLPPEDTTPPSEDTTPSAEDTTPTPEETTLASEETTPPPEDTTPLSEDTTQPAEETTESTSEGTVGTLAITPGSDATPVSDDTRTDLTTLIGTEGTTSTPNTSCPPDYTFFKEGNCCIQISSPEKKPLTWKEASEEAKKNGARMASIHFKKEDDFIRDLVAKQPKGEGKDNPVYFTGLNVNATNGKINNFAWSDNTRVNYGSPKDIKPNTDPWGPKTTFNGNTGFGGISKDPSGKATWGLYDPNQKGGYVWKIDLSKKVPEPGNPTGGGVPGGNNGLPDGYKCTTGCNPSSIKLKAEKGQPSPVDEGPTEKNGCQTDVLSCTTNQPIATITFGTQGSLKSTQANKNNVRAKVICANEEATGKKGWVRNGVDNNPKLIFVEEAHCEQQSS